MCVSGASHVMSDGGGICFVSAPLRYANLLKIPYIYGGTREAERQRILGLFRVNPLLNCVGLSKVGLW